MVDIWRVLLESFVQYRDSKHLRHLLMINPFHPILRGRGGGCQKSRNKNKEEKIIKKKKKKKKKFILTFCNLFGTICLTSLTSLISPTSKCFTSALPLSAGTNGFVGPAPTAVHRDEMLPAPNPLSVMKQRKIRVNKLHRTIFDLKTLSHSHKFDV